MAFSTGGAFSGFTPNATSSNPATGTGTSIFGQANQNTTAPGTTSIFGQPAANTNNNAGNTTGTSIFGQPSTATTGTTPSLFGNTSTNTGTTNAFGSTQPASGTTSLFGQPAAGTNTGGTGTTSLFGNTAAAPTAGTSAFGSTNNATTNTGGIFGSTGGFGGTQPQSTGTTGGIFGQPAQTNTGTTSIFGQPPATSQTGTTGLFGQSAQPAAGTTSMFGQSTAPAQAGTTGLFGQTQPAAGTSAFNSGTGGMFGAKPATPVAPVAQQGQVLFTKSTRFNDLPEDIKRVFEQMDSHIQGRLSIASSLKARKPAAELEKAETLIRAVHQDLLRAASAVHSDGQLVKDVRGRTDRQVEDVITSTRIVDAFRNPGQHGQLRDMADFPLEYFSRVTEDTATRLLGYRTAVEQVERTLVSLVQSLQAQNAGAGMSPQAVGATLQTQHNSALALANRVGAAHAALDRVRALYTQLWRARTGSSRDPFEERFGHGQEERLGM